MIKDDEIKTIENDVDSIHNVNQTRPTRQAFTLGRHCKTLLKEIERLQLLEAHRLDIYVMSREESVDLPEPIKPPAGYGTIIVCAPMETVREVTDGEPHLIVFGYAGGSEIVGGQ